MVHLPHVETASQKPSSLKAEAPGAKHVDLDLADSSEESDGGLC